MSSNPIPPHNATSFLASRRQFLQGGAALLGLTVVGLHDLLAAGKPAFKIGACDWSLGKTADVQAMEVAKQIGLDGVQISLGTVKNDMHLRHKEVQQAYKAAARKHKVEIGGIGLGELNNVPYKSDPRAEEWVSDSIDVAKALGVKVILVAFFHLGDIKNDPQGQQVVIQRLRKVAPKAEKAGVVLGIESWLDAREHVAIMDAVGSPNVQVYYDVANSHKMGYNIYEEIRWLGRDRICEFHMKENDHLLGQGPVNFKEVRRAIDDIGYTGWMQIEGAVPKGQQMQPSYVQNQEYLRTVFPRKVG
jgi:L-ribulose-5-phosphate 3-epimerase